MFLSILLPQQVTRCCDMRAQTRLVTRDRPRHVRHPCHVPFDVSSRSRHPTTPLLPHHTMADASPRPYKRPRLDSSPGMPSSSLSSLTSAPSSPTKSQNPRLKPLPPAVLLVSLPSLLAHPPTHPYYIPSLCLSLCALRRCLDIPTLSPEVECRAWMGLAEIGMRVINGGLHESNDHPWARGIDADVRSV